MPMKSKEQWRALFAKNPSVARRFAHETKRSYKSLPQHVKRKKR